MTEGHISTHFDRELDELKSMLIYEGGLVERAIRDAIKALVERNSELAQKVITDDDIVNAKEVKIDEFCIRLLALRQPAAKDLRFITMAIKINYDLERIGDMAVNISERALELNEEPQLKPYIDLPRMAKIVQKMVRESLDAFVREDVELAWKVTREDAQVDQLCDQIFRELLTCMMQDMTN